MSPVGAGRDDRRCVFGGWPGRLPWRSSSCRRSTRVPGPAPAAAASPTGSGTQAEAQSRRAADRIRALQAEADALATARRRCSASCGASRSSAICGRRTSSGLEPEITALSSDVAATTARLDALEEAVRAQQPVLAARLVDTYKTGRAGYVRLWFAVDDLRALGRAYRLVSALARIDRDRIADFRRPSVSSLTAGPPTSSGGWPSSPRCA